MISELLAMSFLTMYIAYRFPQMHNLQYIADADFPMYFIGPGTELEKDYM